MPHHVALELNWLHHQIQQRNWFESRLCCWTLLRLMIERLVRWLEIQ